MGDSEFVASIVSGDPAGLAAAYDKYAGDLYGYCRSLLQDPNDAADAVQDTFVIAASKLGGLRDPERLRAWLFAVARNESLHRLRSRRAAAPLQDASELADDGVDVGVEAERAETIALVRAAADGLNTGERDVINQLWHGLEVPEVAAVLGVSRNHAYTLFSRARDQLEASVGVLLVGRTGRADCATLDSLLGDWDGRLTALLRKRVSRHIDRCEVCSQRRRRELTPALLYDVSPAALLAMAAARGGIPLTSARHLARALSGTRAQVLRLASDPAASLRAARGAGGRSTNPFGTTGLPKPARYGHLRAGQQARLPLAVAGGAVITTAAAVVAAVVLPQQRPAVGLPGGGLTVGTPAFGAAPVVSAGGASGKPAMTPAARIGPATGRPTAGTLPLGNLTTGGGTGAAAGGGTGSARGTSASPGATAGGGLTLTAGPPATGPSTGPSVAPTTGPASGTPVSAPTATAAPPANGQASAPPAAGTAAAGTLAVSPTLVLLSPLLGGTLTLTASGGPVSWSVSEPASLLGQLTVSPASGTLSAGGSATVTLSVTGLASVASELTVEPGGQAVSVVLGLG
jgi:RNA polymerase sigma factor (sigma-70 family)